VITLRNIIHALTNRDIAPLDVCISGAVIDSRQTVEGSLFIALPGEHADGHDYLQAAFDKGAKLALVDREMAYEFNVLDLSEGQFDPSQIQITLPLCLKVPNVLTALQKIAAYWRGQHPIRAIGITGSVGKTSTKELTAALLSQQYQVLKNPGNRNNEIGLPLSLLELDEAHEIAVLEMGFYVPGEIRLLCEIAQPQIGVVTNIGMVHAERAGSQEIIARGKAELVESLPSSPEGIAILNIDDPRVRAMAQKTNAQVLSYGITDKADLNAADITTHALNGVSCTLNYQGKAHQVHSPLLGEFSIYTILCGTAAALALGMDWEAITAGLSTARIDLRMRQLTLPNGAVILDDTYNASPASTIAALQLLAGLQGRRIAILGDMLELGIYEESGHQSVGRTAANAADLLILVGERSKVTAQAAIENGFSEDYLQWHPDSQQAANPAASLIQKGDVVLIKGSNSMHMDKILTALKGTD